MQTRTVAKQSHKQAYELARWLEDHRAYIETNRPSQKAIAALATQELKRTVSYATVGSAAEMIGFEWPKAVVRFGRTGIGQLQGNKTISLCTRRLVRDLTIGYLALIRELGATKEHVTADMLRCGAEADFLGVLESPGSNSQSSTHTTSPQETGRG